MATRRSGQGVVAETLNLSRLDGYEVGGIVHIIANNQLGFTAGPQESYSTSYVRGLARGFKIPIVHVNADDPRACIEAARLAWAYRHRFRLDSLIDLVWISPMVTTKATSPPLHNRRSTKLSRASDGARAVRSPAHRVECDHVGTGGTVRQEAYARARTGARGAQTRAGPRSAPSRGIPCAKGAGVHCVPLERLATLNFELLKVPSGFCTENPPGARTAQHDADVPTAPRSIGLGEDLAFGSTEDGIAIRLTGEDVERGTFSQRHSAA